MILRRKREFFFVDTTEITRVVANLRFLYHSVIASENLLSCAISQLSVLAGPDCNGALQKYLVEHLEEERDEARLLAEDLESHGVIIGDCDVDAMAMVGSQYYMIYHLHPACILGYMAVVEGTPTPLEEVEKLERIYGRRLMRFVRMHSINDESHKVGVFEQIDSLPESLIGGVWTSACVTLAHLENAAMKWR